MNIKILILTILMSFLSYFAFFTGPEDLKQYPKVEESPYHLPWEAGVSRWVSQGNRSFTTHRGFYYYSWDFWFPWLVIPIHLRTQPLNCCQVKPLVS